MKKLLLIPLTLVLTWLIMPTQTVTSDDANTIEELVPALMEEAAIPSIVLAKVEQGKVSYSAAFGLADIANSQKATVDTLYNIASISKPILGIALLKLVDQGMLDIDEDINKYLSFEVKNPNFPEDIITVRHLASHSSGIADYYDIKSYSINQDSTVSLKQHLKSFLTPRGDNYENGGFYLKTKPGEARKYSNLAAGVAGQLVEEITGLTLTEYSKKHVFPLLGMNKSSWQLNDLSLSDIAIPYEVNQCVPFIKLCANTEEMELNYIIGEYLNPPYENKEFIAYPHFGNPQYPDGGVRTSIKQLSQLMASVLTNQTITGESLLSELGYKQMFALQLDQSVSKDQRFFWRDKEGLTGHMGSDLGVFTSMYFDIESKSGFIILMNRGYDAKATRAGKKIAQFLMNSRFIEP